MADIFQIVENNGTPKNIEDRKSRINTAPFFSTTTSYSIGDIVMYEGNLHEFQVAHPAGSWNNNQSITTNLGNKITEAKILILEFASLSATSDTLVTIPSSGTNSKIKSYTKPLPILNLQHPEYQLDDWTIEIPDGGGSVSIKGTASNTGTSGKIYLVNAQ